MRGKIERIWENQTKDGEKYWVLSIDGKNYSVWDPAVLEGLSEGMEVEYEFRRSGKYNRITDLKKLDTSQRGPDAESPRDLKIIRDSCKSRGFFSEEIVKLRPITEVNKEGHHARRKEAPEIFL